MKEIKLPQGYKPLLSIYETQKAIDLGNRLFADKLAGALRLHRVSAPLFVSVASGLNDDLNGVERAVVQPTLLIPGEEFDRLRAEVLANAGDMAVSLGLPLLWDDGDLIPLTKLLERAYPMEEDQVLLAMGHGTDHSANGIYHRLARCMAERSGRLALCTVEGTPSFQDAIDALLAQERRRVHLAPLLLVAGDHSKNDMAGDGPDSLRTLLEQAGFQVTWSLRGLGELPEVREKLVRRARSAFEVLPEK